MPAVRDSAFAYTSAAATTIDIPMPAVVQSDILLAFLSADTGAQTWTCSGWTQAFSYTFTSNLAVMWKLAGPAEPDIFTFTGNVSETYNGAIVSIKDAHTTSPFGGTAVTGTSTACKSSLPTMTCTANDCLLFYFAVEAAASVPSIIEGPVTVIYNKDGSAHSDGVAWGFQPLSGTTPNNVVVSNMGASWTKLMVSLAIKPPDAGATYKPTYCAADSSIYLSPFTGAAFNGDSAPATTVNQYFGRHINSRALSAAGSTITQADFGLNLAYHASTFLTAGYVTANLWSGHHTLFAAANRPDITNKNVLFHIMPYNPIDIQTTDDAGLGGTLTRGVAIGFESETALGSCQTFAAATSVTADVTTGINNSTTNDVRLAPFQSATIGDSVYFGNDAKFSTIVLTIGTAGTYTAGTLQWQYYNGAWTAFTPNDDPTAFLKTAVTRGIIRLPASIQADWTSVAINGVTAYWIRCVVTINPSAFTSSPSATQGWRGKFKVWHVGGSGTSWGTTRTPVVIHPDNTTGLLSNYGLDSAGLTAINDIGCFLSGKLVRPRWTIISAWALDTITIAGGTVASPVDVPGIYNVSSYGHERISVLQQGASQLTCFQPLQFGDGGTHPIYLDLNSTAIEFPRLYNQDFKAVNYCSVENFAGITYYPSSSDTIKHRNSVISSPSKYKWGFHSAASPNATYDFNGLQIIGAGTITLTAAIPLDGITFASCDTISAADASIKNCVFNSSTAIGALIVTSASGMSAIRDCSFSDNTYYSIRATSTSAQTYALSGITFSNSGSADIWFAADAGTATINVIGGGSTPTTGSAGCLVVINNYKTLTLTDLVSGSEVRIYAADTITELGGIESCDETFAFQYNYVEGTYVDIVIHNEEYIYYRIDDYLLGENDASLPIQQQVDRQYSNPT